jgi:hypothetical protein
LLSAATFGGKKLVFGGKIGKNLFLSVLKCAELVFMTSRKKKRIGAGSGF